MAIRSTTDGRPRSVAWVFYTVLAVCALIAGFGHPAMFLGAIGLGAYAWYLFRGGRFVVWFF